MKSMVSKLGIVKKISRLQKSVSCSMACEVVLLVCECLC